MNVQVTTDSDDLDFELLRSWSCVEDLGRRGPLLSLQYQKKMKSDTLLDYAVFQLSPKRSRCELFISGDGTTEKLTSGLLKPFITHLMVAEEQAARAVQSIKLEVEKHKNAGTWFTKGTLERFVRFVSTPEVLEIVNTFDAEMSQLEGARRIYSQGGGDKLSSSLGGDGTGAPDAADITKKELLRAIDVRLVAVKQDLTTALARASAAGFTLDTVSELQLFSDRFGAHRLNEASSQFISLCQRRPELIFAWKTTSYDQAVRTSSGSDMSIDDLSEKSVPAMPSWSHQSQSQYHNQQHTHQDHDATQPPENSKSFACQQPKSSFTFSIQRSSDRDESSEGTFEKEKDKEEIVTESSQVSQSSRRLSVQDRINLFENKQKEHSGSGGKVALGKSVELRRLPSDVSSTPPVVEKAVLRRWSGGSDMSVDSSSDRKELEGSSTTPCSSTNSQTQSSKSTKFSGVNEDRKDDLGSRDTATTSKAEFKGSSGRLDDSGLKDLPVTPSQDMDYEAQVTASFGSSEDVRSKDQLASQTQMYALTGKLEKVGWKDQAPFESQSLSYSGWGDVDLKNRAISQAQFRSYPGGAEQSGLQDQTSPQNMPRTPFAGAELPEGRDQVASQSQFLVLSGQDACQMPSGASVSRTGSVELRDHHDSQALFKGSPSATVGIGSYLRQPPVSHIQGKAFSGKLEGGAELKDQAAFQAQYRGFEGDQLVPPSQWSSFPGKVEDVGRKKLASSGMHYGDLPPKVENNLHGTKLQRQSSAPEQSKKSQGRRGESTPVNGNSEMFFPGRKIMESPEVFGSSTITPVEQTQKIRQSKGSQELNDELQLKANELEKLFAAHKLRVTGDQPSSVRRTKGPDAQIEKVASAMYRTSDEVTPSQMHEKNPAREPFGSSSNVVEFDFSSLIKMVDNQDYGNTLRQNITEFGSPEDSRGKFYDKYMQKREEKLREEWSSKRAQKEAKMKAMQDSLERSRAEMKAKFSGTPSQQDSALHARRRAEKLRSFNIRLASKNREQQPIESVLSENDDDSSEFTGDTQYGQDISFNGIASTDGSSRSTQSKKLLPSRSSSSSTPQISAVPAPRSSAKGSNPSSGRRRVLPEYPLAQSFPNFSDLRKENTKPSTGIGKTATRSQFRNFTRSKSTSDELPLVKEDKPRRPQSMRKSSASPGELKDSSPQNSDGVVLAPVRYEYEQTDEGLYSKSPKNAESLPLYRRGNGIGSGAVTGLAKMTASMASDPKNEEESDEVADQPEDLVDMVNGEEEEGEEEEEEEFGRVTGEDTLRDANFPADSDNEKSQLSQESENGDGLRSVSQVDDNLVVDVAASGPVTFHASAGNVQESPGESPASWNSHVRHPFSYVNETSDIDASLDSPVGSPALWNLHSLSQMESDAARMRKKWGSAQKPVLMANTSHHLSRKDMTKGFKRLLKFGRKSRGSESLVDWKSATTSEGDDDTEDGRDPVNRSSEDARKSRMGSSQGHPSYDGFNEGELFNEQVQALRSSIPAPPANFKLREDHLSGSSLKAPRSFFSLSSFRSKGTESKPR